MTPLVTLAAIALFAAGGVTGIIGLVSLAIRQEEKSLTLTSEATNRVTLAGRRVNGVYVRPRSPRPAGPP